jgi:hypothetical protein
MVSNQIEDNFTLLESNLWQCNGCKTTFENENECNNHLEELENNSN